MLSTRSNQATIMTLGSTQTQKICGILSTTINDAVDVNFYLISKITIVIPSREIDISQMRHINHLNLADPSFNIPSKVDVLLGADVVEEILLENKIKDNGLYLRDSILGWVEFFRSRHISVAVQILGIRKLSRAKTLDCWRAKVWRALQDHYSTKYWGKTCGPNANQEGITKAWQQWSKCNEAISSLGADAASRWVSPQEVLGFYSRIS